MTIEELEQRIIALEKECSDYIRNAERQASFLNGRIEAHKELLAILKREKQQ